MQSATSASFLDTFVPRNCKQMQSATPASFLDTFVPRTRTKRGSVPDPWTQMCPRSGTKRGHLYLAYASTTRSLENMQDPVSNPASSKPLRRRETAQPVDSKQLVGRGQQRTSPRFRLQHQQIFPRGHWVRAQHFTSGPCKSHESNQSTPYRRQRLPHQNIWHTPNPTSTGATEIFLAFYSRQSHSTHHRG